jgi:hypothetical protein
MAQARMTRRLAKVFGKRLPEAALEEVADPRERRGRRWNLGSLLRALVLGLSAGCRSLQETEELTARMSHPMRRLLGVARRLPDTTARDLLCRLCPTEVRKALHRLVRQAQRRKALSLQQLPFGMVAMDGKATAIEGCDDLYAQRQSRADGTSDTSVVRTVSCSLVTAAGRPCIDVVPIPASTNEMGHFETAFRQLTSAYQGLGLFRLVSYDAGACSLDNAGLVVEQGYHYLFGLKGTQPTLLEEAERLLAGRSAEQADAFSEDVVAGKTVVRRAYLTGEMAGYLDWHHLGTVVRIESETLDRDGGRVSYENRYYVSSLVTAALRPEQWLYAVRAHWGVENNCHHTWDTAFEEDGRPWIQAHPRATVVVMVLRRIAYNILTLFRSVTQRSEDKRQMPWKPLLRDVYVTVSSATEDLSGRRPRELFITP